ncbi:MAG: hypothetical protein ABI947_27830 [Chloroflexota bacterium]
MIENTGWKLFEFPDGVARSLWRDEAVRVSVAVFLVLRLVTGIAALIMVADVPAGKPPLLWFDPVTRMGNPSGETFEASLPVNSPLASLVAPWNRYDTAWYDKVAIQGYRPDNGIVFPPLYPLLIRLLAPFCGGSYVLAALIISNIACLLSFILLYKLIQREFHDSSLATRTLIALAAFPTAFYLVAGYTEPIFLALTLGAFLAAFDKKWWLAGILAFFASLTRLQGVVLCLPLAWIAYVQFRERGPRAILERVPAVLGAALGTASYTGYIALSKLGSFENAYNIGWKLTSRPPWESIMTYFDRLRGGITQYYENSNALILLVMVILAIVVTIKFQPAYSLYVWSSLFVILLRYHYGILLEGAQFESVFRYSLLLFPCFIAAAKLFQRWWMLVPYGLVMLVWQAFLLHNFLHWIWVA